MKKLEKWFRDPSESAGPRLRLLAIVGFGGVGKSTLAMALYNKLGHTFGCRAYALVSQKFHLPTVLRDLCKQIHEQQAGALKSDLNGIEEWKQDVLRKKLTNQLQGKRYKKYISYVMFNNSSLTRLYGSILVICLK